ncbi:MAG: hypothetical protein AAB552_00420 [Patescibacteria group bacterium]|mgnify:CR=1 FL=1
MKKFASLLCAATLLLSVTFVPTIASASTINTELASNPTATIAEIEKIGFPMSDEMAGEMRGEFTWYSIALGIIFDNAVFGANGSNIRTTFFSPIMACSATVSGSGYSC